MISSILLSFGILTYSRPESISNILKQIIPFQSEKIEIVKNFKYDLSLLNNTKSRFFNFLVQRKSIKNSSMVIIEITNS